MSLLFLLLGALIFMSGVMTAAWIYQRDVGNGGWIDVFWTFGTGLAGAGAALIPLGPGEPAARQWIAALLIAAWSLRLGLYIAFRVARSPEDRRYVKLREQWGAAADRRLFWFLQAQAVVTVLLCLSIAVAARHPAPDLRLGDLLAVLVFVAAVAGEALSDAQMRRFKADKANDGKVCDRGLWAWSRHPNYFFEWIVWLAWPVMAFDLSGAYPQSWLAFIAPIVMYAVLRYMTGVPPLEAAMLETKGDAYRAYQRRTGAFFPRPPTDA